MKQKLLKTMRMLLVAVLLGAGASNAWAGVTNIFSQESWVHTHDGGTGDRSSSLSFNGTSSIDNNWTTSFDVTTSSTNSRTNGTRNFQIALLSASAASFPSNVLATSNILLGARFQTVTNTDYSSFACTITVNDVEEAGTVTLNHGTKYTFNVTVNGTSMTVSIKNGATSVFSKAVTLGAFVKPKGIYDLLPRPYNAGWGVYTNTYNNVLVTKEVDEETVSAPSISAPTYAGANRTITITGGTSSESNSVTTYYTIDGTDPSSSNYVESFTTASKGVTITSSCTVKAISISSTDVESSIISQAVTAGMLTLNAPTITVTNLVANGDFYNATYSFASDQSDLLGSPTATLSYTFAGGSSTEGTSYTPTTAGKLIVTASAANYTSKSTTIDIKLPNYVRTYFADFTTLEKGDKQGYSSYQVNKAGCDFYSFTNTLDELTLSGFSLAWAITNAYVVGLHTRGSAGTVTYNESFADGSIIDFSCASTTSTYHIYSTTAATIIPQYVGVYNMGIYSPIVSTTISAAGYATYCSPYALDFSGVSGLKAYRAYKDGTEIKFEAVDEVPAGEGILLKGDADTYNVPVIASASDITNVFVGVTAETTIPYASESDAIFVLKNGASGVGFYKTKKAFTVRANSAYLPASVAAGRAFIGFEDETTGISLTPTLSEGERAVYNLQGQRVNANHKGLVIKNGKKVLVK